MLLKRHVSLKIRKHIDNLVKRSVIGIFMIIKDILSRQEELGTTKYYHEILTKGSDFEFSQKRVLHFFQKYQLVSYSYVHVIGSESLPASSHDFEGRLQKALLKNRQLLHNLLNELRSEGYTTISDLQTMPQGYRTKIFHVITHLLDGFFGLDSHFYNLEEDSHWVSEAFWKKIMTNPSHYWLLPVEAEF